VISGYQINLVHCIPY